MITKCVRKGGATYSFLHEYPPQAHEKMVSELRNSLGGGPYFHGFLRNYTPGFFRTTRVLNFVYIYLLAPWWVWRARRTTLITVTTPPGIQLWLAFWCYLFGGRLIVWLMDYHPEIEARALEKRRWTRFAASFLRRVDAWALQQTSLVVALDQAIASIISQRQPGTSVIVHPTWTTQANASPRLPFASSVESEELVILHAGNLGQSHDLVALTSLLRGCQNLGRSVKLIVTGGSHEGNDRFEEMARELAVRIKVFPRLPYEELQELIAAEQVGVGLVLMKDSAAGLVSPSKFYTYLQLGLPLLYIGPAGTNADTVCREFSAGYALPNQFALEQIADFEQKYFSREMRTFWAARVTSAAEWFQQRNADSLAKAIRQFVSDRSSSDLAIKPEATRACVDTKKYEINDTRQC